MRLIGLSLLVLAQMASAQLVDQCFDRDTNEPFKFKSVSSNAVVKGPMVKRTTVYTFDNPAKKLTEATIAVELKHSEVLGGFGYWYKDEFVPGTLMDKQKAWFIYTAITSRNEDPGIMVQKSPSS